MKKSKQRGSPVVTFRLKASTRAELDRVSRALGYADRSGFLRDFVEVTVAGDLEGLHGFLAKCTRRAFEQAQMKLKGFENGAEGRPVR
jgi:hypothetical protein